MTRIGLIAVALALGLSACGAAKSDRAQIVEVIETDATSTDPENCSRLETRREIEQVTFDRGERALAKCRRDTADAAGKPRSVTVSGVRVAGRRARATVTIAGGDLDRQTARLSLLKVGDQWKIDHFDSFEKFDRGRFLAGIGRSLRRPPDPLSRGQANCALRQFSKMGENRLQALFLSGDPGWLLSVLRPCVPAGTGEPSGSLS